MRLAARKILTGLASLFAVLAGRAAVEHLPPLSDTSTLRADEVQLPQHHDEPAPSEPLKVLSGSNQRGTADLNGSGPQTSGRG